MVHAVSGLPVPDATAADAAVRLADDWDDSDIDLDT